MRPASVFCISRKSQARPNTQRRSTVLADTEDVWKQQFSRMGGSYRDPKLVLFRDVVDSACGSAESATGPFYCPGDQKVYIDLGFYDELDRRFGDGEETVPWSDLKSED